MAFRRSIYPHNLTFNKGSLSSSLLRHRFSVRSIVRPGSGVIAGRMGSRRGGFFGSVFKGIKKVVSTVAKVPVISTVAKTALSSLPIVGGVVTAVTAVKKLTASGVAPSAQLVNQTATPGVVAPLAMTASRAGITGTAPKRKKAKKRKATKRKKSASRSRRPKKAKKGGTAKQRAARARFARAAKKGRIKKGQKL